MSAVTVETMRADYEAAQAIADSHPGLETDRIVGGLAHLRRKLELRLVARDKLVLWDIARKHGVPAAMLFKLSDGAIDPRDD